MEQQTIYGLIANNNSGIYWFRDKNEVVFVSDEDTGLNMFSNAELALELNFPANLDLEKCGFIFFELEDYK